MAETLLDITFLRHGRSRADDEGVFEGRYDAPLTEVGQAQARARAEGWRRCGVTFDLAICSPLQRAVQTAEIVTAALQVPLEKDPGWMELDHGALSGMPIAEAEVRYPRPAFRGPFEPIAGTGESDIDLHARVALALERLVRRGPGRYLVVAHGGSLNAALHCICGAAYSVNRQGIWFKFNDLGYARLTYDPTCHRWTMRELAGD